MLLPFSNFICLHGSINKNLNFVVVPLLFFIETASKLFLNPEFLITVHLNSLMSSPNNFEMNNYFCYPISTKFYKQKKCNHEYF